MNTNANRVLVEQALERVAHRCRQNRALVLAESDLKCQVYLELSRIEAFGSIRNTFDNGVMSSAIHTETKFFNELGLLSQAPDLVITDPSRLSIRQRLDGGLLPSKDFYFDGSAILTELKFHRRHAPVSARELARIEGDILKGEGLNRRNLNFHLFVAVFDRFNQNQDIVQNVFNLHRGQENLTCRYFHGGDPW